MFRGERPFEDLKAFTDCRARVTRPEARKALALALKAAAPTAKGSAAVAAAAAMPVSEVPGSAVPAGSGAASGAAPAHATKPHKKRARATQKPPAESKTTPSS